MPVTVRTQYTGMYPSGLSIQVCTRPDSVWPCPTPSGLSLAMPDTVRTQYTGTVRTQYTGTVRTQYTDTDGAGRHIPRPAHCMYTGSTVRMCHNQYMDGVET